MRGLLAHFGLTAPKILAGVEEQTAENNPTIAVHAEAATFGISLSHTEAAYIAEAAIAASGLRTSIHSRSEEPR